MPPIFIGQAGWSISSAHAAAFPQTGSHLERYAARFGAVEINSSFYRPHRPTTYARWAASVPDGFRFAVKLPRAITHGARLADAHDLLTRFFAEIRGLGGHLGPLLVQLPPSLAFDRAVAQSFFDDMRSRFGGDVACEPRHTSWFGTEAKALLTHYAIARVAADPQACPGADAVDTAGSLVYIRLHGSPRMYHSPYTRAALLRISQLLVAASTRGQTAWCILDNTASGAALGDALTLVSFTAEAAPPLTAPWPSASLDLP